MDSPDINASIASTLDGLDLLLNSPIRQFLEHRGLTMQLKKLKMFVLIFTRYLDNQLHDPNLPSFLLRIEDAVTDGKFNIFNIIQLSSNIRSLFPEIRERCFTLKDSVLLQLSDSIVTIDDISEIITSVSEFVEDILYPKAPKHLSENVKALKTLICFVDKPTPQLLAHAKHVAIQFCVLIVYLLGQGFIVEERLEDLVSTWMPVINPIDPRVSETYIQALTTSKLSRQLPDPTHYQYMDDGAFIAAKNFLDSLIHNLWELLQHNTVCVLSMKDHLQELYHKIRSLRTILKQQQQQPLNNIKVEIVSLLYNAGVLIFSLYQTRSDIDIGYFHDLLKTTKTILLQFGEKDTPVQAFNFPKTNQLGFVDFVLEKVVDLRTREAEPTPNSERVQTIHEELVSLRSFLGDIEEFHKEGEELQALWNSVLEVAYKVESLIDHLLVCDIPVSSSTSVDAIMKDIRDIKLKIEVMKPEIEGKRQQHSLKEAAITYNHMSSQTISLDTKIEVVGFADDAKLIVDRLQRGPKQLKVIAIVGMPGLGKTTLATKVYNGSSISHHFNPRAWCPISQALDKKNVLFKLLKQVDPNCECSDRNDQELVEKLWHQLKGKRYLIFLDDIWDTEAWNSLAQAFPDDCKGSRIILTSRHENGVAPSDMLDQAPHSLKPLNETESLKLFQQKLFLGNDDLDPALRDFVMQIVAFCKGLPLTIIITAGILANTKPQDWMKICKDLNSGDASVTDLCRDSLELSYKSLPDHLKPCLLYFGAFLEDAEIPTEKLLYLWIAEGFVQKVEGKHIKEVAEDYLNGLIGRSLIMVSQRKWNGRVKTCKIHDLLLDYCLQKAKDEHFLHLLKGIDELSAFNEPCNLRRLCIQSEANHFKESKLFCPRVRSLFFQIPHRTLPYLEDASFVIRIFKLLRVLDLEEIELRCEFPSEISLLVQLAFLAIQGKFEYIPSSIAKLSNLESLRVNPCGWLILPESLWSLKKLKYLCIWNGDGIVPIEKNDNAPPILYELDVFSGSYIPYDCNLERLMTKFPNLRKLKCSLGSEKWSCSDDSETDDETEFIWAPMIVFPDFLRQLESIHLLWKDDYILSEAIEFRFPKNLKKLKLRDFYLSWKNVSTISKLPNLQVFKLSKTQFEGNTWEMKEGEFCQLRILVLEGVKLVRWAACDDQFECLQKLDLRYCFDLEEMPCNCLENIETLETIEAFDCSVTIAKLVKQIGERQVEEWGNSNFKIKIAS